MHQPVAASIKHEYWRTDRETYEINDEKTAGRFARHCGRLVIWYYFGDLHYQDQKMLKMKLFNGIRALVRRQMNR